MMIRLPRGVLVAIEGIDGAGKTTQAKQIGEALAQVGLDVVCRKEPTDGKWGSIVRESAKTGRLSPEAELDAFMNDRREHVANVIEPALKAGRVVIVDRYYFSTAAYQGARGLDPATILAMNEAFAPPPDLLVLLEVSPEVGARRIKTRDGEGNHFEQIDSQRAVAKQFERLDLPAALRMDGCLPATTITDTVLRTLYAGALFRSECRKANYLSQCEPAYCHFRLNGACRYPQFGPLAPVLADTLQWSRATTSKA